jgi:hypothetical protein
MRRPVWLVWATIAVAIAATGVLVTLSSARCACALPALGL